MTDQPDPTAYTEVLARLLCAADVHVHGEDHPTWQQLVGEPGSRIRDDYRKAASWLASRLTVTSRPPADPADLRDRIAEALEQADYRPDMRRGDLADAVLPVLPPSVDRATVYRELADQQERTAATDVIRRRRSIATARRLFAVELRRMADEAQPAEAQPAEAYPPAAAGLPAGTLEAAEIGANRLDAWARTPNGRNFLAHALVQLARAGWLRTEPGEGFEPERPAVEAQPMQPQQDNETASPPTTPCRAFVSGGTVWCCEEGETDCPCVCHEPAVGAQQDGAPS